MALRFLLPFVNWILYTSFFAACCAVSLCVGTERLLLQDAPPLFTPLHVLIFGSTLLVYNTHYLIKKSSPDVSDRFRWSQHHKLWHYSFWGLGLVCCVGSVLYMPPPILFACGVLGLLSFAYSLPLLPFKNKRRLKDFGWVKILVLTTVWTIVTSILPMLYWDKPFSAYPFEILIRFVFMFALCIAFDIRDMQTDLEADIYTLPNIIGLKGSYRLIYITIALFVALCIVQYVRYPIGARLTGEMLTAVVTIIAIQYAKKYPSDKAYLGLVDGMMLLYGLLVA